MTTTVTATACPKCGKRAKAVKPITLRALLKDELAGQAADADYRFCDTKDCDVVYFGHDQTFTRSQLKVPVGVKETTGERPLCYCFGHSVATIKEELRTKGGCDALADIRRKMKDPGCACEVKNPSGSCCLGSVAKEIETAKAELKGTTPTGSRAETISKVGAVLSAIVASSCCWLPLVLLAIGVSGAGIAGAMESYRPLFILLTFGFLATAFYFTYRPRETARLTDDCCATSRTCCATSSQTGPRRINVRTLNKVMLWCVTLVAILFLFFPKYVGLFLGGNREPMENNPLATTTAFTVEGMTCEGCSALVEKVIRDVPGVLSVQVDYDQKRAVVSTEACCPVPTEAVLQALKKAGYRGSTIETSEPPSPRREAQAERADAQQVDHDREIVFTVQGFT